MPLKPPPLLRTLGDRVRRARRAHHWTLKDAAAAAGLSTRFLADVEAGRGNISVVRLADLARALSTPLPDLLREPGPARFALLGLRGAGKSTVGRLVAQKAGLRFHELDGLVEEAAGLPLPELFAVHGEAYYRRLEREALESLLGRDEASVVAAGGGIVTDPASYARLRDGFTTVWLRARPEEHMSRVEAQGDLRPMARRADAMAELKEILAARSPLYSLADHVVDTSGKSPDRVAD
jgi:XRE family aerobic/anaerobic benzoate catabolism transcriptional regulator